MRKALNIEQLDKNFAAATVDCGDVEFFSPRVAPMRMYGLYQPEEPGDFRRMPPEIAAKVNPGVDSLNWHTAGGRIRFRTDATKLVVKSILPSVNFMKHMPLSGSTCFDVYVDGEFAFNLLPNYDIFDTKTHGDKEDRGFYAARQFPDSRMRQIELYFPLYNPVSDVLIGLSKGAALEAPEDYTHEVPVVYYGSSITQGGCVSHPGNSYQAILSRRFDCKYTNLGFSGNGRAEPVIAQYIAGLNMSAFVMDYDYNAPTVEHLEQTHEAMFREVRQAQPMLPIIIVSAADKRPRANPRRREVILRTYQNARNAGDENVYFVDGDLIYAQVGEDLCTVDGCHPNDLGFWCMANAIGEALEKALKK